MHNSYPGPIVLQLDTALAKLHGMPCWPDVFVVAVSTQQIAFTRPVWGATIAPPQLQRINELAIKYGYTIESWQAGSFQYCIQYTKGVTRAKG